MCPAHADRALPEPAGKCPVWKAKTSPDRGRGAVIIQEKTLTADLVVVGSGLFGLTIAEPLHRLHELCAPRVHPPQRHRVPHAD